MTISVTEVKSILQFNEDMFIQSHLMIISALKEHVLKQSSSKSHLKIIDIFNEVTDTVPDVIRNSFLIEEEVNVFFSTVDSEQCSNALL